MSEILWTSASPLWAENHNSDLSGIKRPAILRFASDSFMDEFANMLANQPARLTEYLAWPETWRDPLPTPTAIPALPEGLRTLQRRLLGGGAPQRVDISDDLKNDTRPLKLYQPAHQRYYLLVSSLVCRQVGLPDHALNTSAQEKASFVVRRLMLSDPQRFANNPPPAPDRAPAGVYDEYALVNGAWQKTTNDRLLLAGEEQNPLFTVCYAQADGHRRRLLGGLIPVGRREAYMAAKNAAPTSAATLGGATQSAADPRLDMLLRRDFFAPWERLIESASDLVEKMGKDRLPTATDDLTKTQGKQFDEITKKRLQIQETSWYLLLDLANFLAKHLPAVLDKFQHGTTPAAAADRQAATALENISLPQAMARAIHAAYTPDNPDPNSIPGTTYSLGQALAEIIRYQAQLDEGMTRPYTVFGQNLWPGFLFPLVDLATCEDHEWTENGPWNLAVNFPRHEVSGDVEYEALLNELREALLAALPTQSPLRLPPIPLAAQVPAAVGETGWFVARCVLERPNCFPAPDATVSDPTAAFQLAGFFDPDAPARPIRIALPVDTTPAGLRKFDKNTAFMISDVLCGQVSRAQNLGLGDLIRSVLPWPLHKDLDVDTKPCDDGNGVTLGMICSLSIPIITICALILLMIIVSLLDIIFRWIPYFIFCFPLPGFKAKKADA